MIDGVMDKIAGVHSELAVKIYGDDFKENRRIAEDIISTLKTVKGAVDLAIDQEPPLPQLPGVCKEMFQWWYKDPGV